VDFFEEVCARNWDHQTIASAWLMITSGTSEMFMVRRNSSGRLAAPYDPSWPDKTEIPEDGVTLKCSLCEKSDTDRRFEFRYQPS
jgi:hypothetical protein